MSIRFVPAAALAAVGVLSAFVLPAAAANTRHLRVSAENCGPWTHPCPRALHSVGGEDRGLDFRLFWEPPLADSTANGGIGAVPPPTAIPWTE